MTALTPFILKVLFPSISCEENLLALRINYVKKASLKTFPNSLLSTNTIQRCTDWHFVRFVEKKEGRKADRKKERK